MSQENNSLVNRIAVNPKDSKNVLIPVLKDDKVFYCVPDGKTVILSEYGMVGELLSTKVITGFATADLTVITDRESGFVIFDEKNRPTYLTIEGDLCVIENVGLPVISTAVPKGLSLPGSYITAGNGRAFLTHIQVIEDEDQGLILKPQVMQLEAHIPNELMGYLTFVNHGADWSVYSIAEDGLTTKGGLYSLHKNKLSRLPVEMVDVVPAVRGIEVIKHSKAKGYTSSFIPLDDIERAIKGNTARIKLIVDKDNTELKDFKGTGPYMTVTNTAVTKGILLEQGLYVPSDQGLNKLVQPFTNRPLTIVGNKNILVVATS